MPRFKVPDKAALMKEPERPAKAKQRAGLPPLKAALIEGIEAKMVKSKQPMRMNTYEDAINIPDVTKWVKTGIFELDLLLSSGKGLPCGRFMEIFGAESSGKTALTQYIMGLFHNQVGTPPRLYPYEYDASKKYLASYGLHPRDVLMAEQIETIEDGCDLLVADLDLLMARRKKAQAEGWALDPPSVYVWDSVAMAPSHAELYEDTMRDKQMAEMARAMSKLFRKITRRVAFNDVCVIFVNQIREKIGGGGKKGGGPQTTTPGGRALRFGASVRIKTARIETVRGARGLPIAQICLLETKKNKLDTPWPLKCELMLSYKRGIDPDWSNFCWFQGQKIIVPAGKKGYRWEPAGEDSEPFLRQDFGEWFKANRKDVHAVRDECYEKILAAAPKAGNKEDDGDDGEDSSDD